MSGERRGRVLVIALQEATLDLVRPWAEEGVLPTFQHMLEGGACGRVRASLPLSTPHLWATILTGRNAGEHGIYDFRQRGPDGRFRWTDATSFGADPLWRILSDRGLTGGFANVPLTWPPQPLPGFMISGASAPGSHRSIAEPPEIYDRLVRRVGAYRPRSVLPGGREKSDYPELFVRSVSQMTDAFAFLLREQACDLYMLYFSEAALAQHCFWADMESRDASNPYRDAVQTAYRCLDRAIARLIDAAGPETSVFVVSECGAGPLRYGVQIDTWLEQEGFLKRRSSSSPRVLNRARAAAAAAAAGARNLLQSRLPEPLLRWCVENLPSVDDWSRALAAGADIDWSRTRAYTEGREGNLFINLQGRDPRGLVRPGAEYEAMRDRLVERLSALGDPDTGAPAVARAYRAEELFQGALLESAPDVLIEWADTAYMPTEQPGERDRVFTTCFREGTSWPTSGGQRMQGMLLATGPGIEAGRALPDAGLCDLLPTWLAALGAPAPEGLPGRVVPGLLDEMALCEVHPGEESLDEKPEDEP